LDVGELGSALGLLGVTLAPAEVACVMASLDQDRSGEVDLHEFQCFVLGVEVPSLASRLL
jgi:Ca2+-binding EF-hand superfamily protein